MSVTELLREIENLSTKEKLELTERLCELTENDIPASFHEGMVDIREGRVVDTETALKKPFPAK